MGEIKKHTDCTTPGCHCTATYIEGLKESRVFVKQRLKNAGYPEDLIEILAAKERK